MMTRFNQFDSSRNGQLNSFDLQRLLAKDETIEAREDCVKMVSQTNIHLAMYLSGPS